MKFSNIEINNFRQYYNSVNVDLETNNEKNIIIIGGRNGYGKTNFLLSIVWCLFCDKISQIDENFKKNEEFSFKVYQLFCDGFSILPGDIFVNTELSKRFTLVQNEPITVPIGIDSTSHVTISRPVYNNTNGFGARRDCGFYQPFIKIEGVFAYVYKYGDGTTHYESIGSRDEGVGGHDDFVARNKVNQKCCHLQGRSA